MQIGYLGPPGSFCEEATLRLKSSGRLAVLAGRLSASNAGKWGDIGKESKEGGEGIEGRESNGGYSLVPKRTSRELILAVESGELAAAVVPIENSIEGSVSETLDSLISSENLIIQGEIVIPVSHNLMAWLPEAGPVEEVLSHPQALAQCRNYLLTNFPAAAQQATTSTAEAARLVAARRGARPLAAAIGTARAAELYGLSIIASDIQDVPENETRFVMVARSIETPRSGRDKTSIAFSTVRDRPGALYAILEEFAERSINLTKIESRPTKRMLGEYIFFIDCEGHRTDEAVSGALRALEPKTSYLRILGSYPV